MSAPELNESNRAVANWLNWLFERDYLVHAPAVIQYEHHSIHGANHWEMGTRIPALDGSVSYLFYSVGTAVSIKNFHFLHQLNSGGVARVFLYQDPTVVAPGTLLGNPPWMNNKQGGAGTPSSLEAYINPNISSPGTLRHSVEIGGTGVGGSSSQGESRKTEEIIFANDKYWLAVVDTDAAQIVNYRVTGYEK